MRSSTCSWFCCGLHVALHDNFVGDVVRDDDGLRHEHEHQGGCAAKNSGFHEVTVKIV